MYLNNPCEGIVAENRLIMDRSRRNSSLTVGCKKRKRNSEEEPTEANGATFSKGLLSNGFEGSASLPLSERKSC